MGSGALYRGSRSSVGVDEAVSKEREADADEGECGEKGNCMDKVGLEEDEAGGNAADRGTKTAGGGQDNISTICAGHRFTSF